MSPEVNHKGEPSVKVNPMNPSEAVLPAPSPRTPSAIPLNTPELKKLITSTLRDMQKASVEAEAPKEPDWANLTEEQSYDRAVHIPMISHEIPDYMNIKLKDPEYVPVWASKDQRRLGQLMAEGYELLKEEHVHSDFKLPLQFDSEGLYRYADVVCMRVHKRILYPKRRKTLELSQRQLRNKNRPPVARIPNTFKLEEAPDPSPLSDYYEVVV